MATWRLEVARMALYIIFPVAVFHYFNQPQIFEKEIIDLKRELYPHDTDPDILNLRASIEEFKQKQNSYLLAELKSS